MYFIELRVVKADGEKVYESGNDVTYRQETNPSESTNERELPEIKHQISNIKH